MQSTGGCALAGCKPELTVPGTGPVQRILGAATFAMAAGEEFPAVPLQGAASTRYISREGRNFVASDQGDASPPEARAAR